jgi:hypothetical protein
MIKEGNKGFMTNEFASKLEHSFVPDSLSQCNSKVVTVL